MAQTERVTSVEHVIELTDGAWSGWVTHFKPITLQFTLELDI